MFGTNVITGKKFFKDAPSDSLMVTSMFLTLQGEGPYAGLPALFIRLSRCNLTCQMCDTFFDQGDRLTYDQIEAKAYQIICEHWTNRGLPVPLWALGKRNEWAHSVFGPYSGIILVVTGGEPTLQDNLTEFLTRQRGQYKDIQIETNGLLNTDIPDHVTIVCSPKCSEKEGKAIKYLKPTLNVLHTTTCLKFVMSADPDSPYSTVPEWAHEWKDSGDWSSDREIYVSPMNIYLQEPQQAKILRLTRKEGKLSLHERSTVDEVISFWTKDLLDQEKNQINHEYTAKYALDHGFRLSLQTHLYASLA
jgi:7-carboxy-7-deazaguanine synthase